MSGILFNDALIDGGGLLFDSSRIEEGLPTLVVEFDAGNCDAATSTITANGNEPIVYVRPRSATLAGDGNNGWRVLLWAVENAEGLRPLFRVPRLNRASGDTVNAEQKMLWTQDFKTWTRAPSRTIVGDTTDGYIECQFTDPLPAGRVYVSTHPIAPNSFAGDLAAELLGDYSSVASPTASADAGGVFFTSPAEVDENDRAIGGNDMYAIRLAWGGSTTDGGPKRKLVMFAGIHAMGEHTSLIAFERFLRYCLEGTTDEAIRLRANWDFYLYFNLTPNGIVGGHRRNNFRVGTDPNRVFVSKSLAEIAALTAAVEFDTGSSADVLISWHNLRTQTALFGYLGHPETTDEEIAFAEIGKVVFDGSFDTAASSLTTTDAYYGHDILGCKVSYSAELPLAGNTSIETHNQIGEGWAITLAEADEQGLFWSPISEDITAAESADLGAIIGAAVSAGYITATESADTGVTTGAAVSVGQIAANESQDVGVIAGAAVVVGTITASESEDVGQVQAAGIAVGQIAANESRDTGLIAGASVSRGAITAGESSDAGIIVGNIPGITTGTITAIESADDSAITGRAPRSGTITAMDAGDSAIIVGFVPGVATGMIEAAEAGDDAGVFGRAVASGIIAAVEAGDYSVFVMDEITPSLLRTLVIAAEHREMPISAERRILAITPEQRTRQ